MDEEYDPTERMQVPLGFGFGGGIEFEFLAELGRRDGGAPSGQEDFLVQFGLGSM